jgi:hypothetical protein
MSSERDETRDEVTRTSEEQPMSSASHVHTFDVTPKARTREAIAVVVTLAALFLLLVLLVGHPAAPRVLLHPHAAPPHGTSPAH